MGEVSDHVVIGNLPADFSDESLKTNFEAYGTVKWCRLFNAGNDGKKTAMIEFSSVEEATWLVENLNGNVPLGLETEVTVKYKPAKGAGGKGGGGVGKCGGGGGGGMRSSPYGGGGGGGAPGMGMGMGMGKGGCMGGGMNMGMMGAQCTINDLWKGLIRHKVLPGGTWCNDERTVSVSGLPSDTVEADMLKIFSPFGAILPGGVRVALNEDGTAKGSGMVNFMHLESAESAIQTLNNCMMPDGRFLRLKQWHDWGSKGAKGEGKGAKGGGGGGGGGGGNGAINPGAGHAEG